MITKSFHIMCDDCTNSEMLFSGSIKECEQEARRLGYKKIKGLWVCHACQNEKKED